MAFLFSQSVYNVIGLRSSAYPIQYLLHLTILFQLYRRNNQPHQAVEVLERELAALHEHGLSSETKPDMFWTLHDGLAQSYGTTGKAHKKIEHYELAISILSNYTAPPEVCTVVGTQRLDCLIFLFLAKTY